MLLPGVSSTERRRDQAISFYAQFTIATLSPAMTGHYVISMPYID